MTYNIDEHVDRVMNAIKNITTAKDLRKYIDIKLREAEQHGQQDDRQRNKKDTEEQNTVLLKLLTQYTCIAYRAENGVHKITLRRAMGNSDTLFYGQGVSVMDAIQDAVTTAEDPPRYPVGTRFKLTVVRMPPHIEGDECVLIDDDGSSYPYCYFPRLKQVYPVQLYKDAFSGPQVTGL